MCHPRFADRLWHLPPVLRFGLPVIRFWHVSCIRRLTFDRISAIFVCMHVCPWLPISRRLLLTMCRLPSFVTPHLSYFIIRLPYIPDRLSIASALSCCLPPSATSCHPFVAHRNLSFSRIERSPYMSLLPPFAYCSHAMTCFFHECLPHSRAYVNGGPFPRRMS